MEDANAEVIVQEANPEQVEEPTEAPPQDEPRFERSMATLAKRERQLRERESKIKEVQGKLSEYEQTYRLAQEDPLAFMKKHGVSEDDLVRKMIDTNGTPTQEEVIRRQESEISSLRNEFQDYRDTEKLKATKEQNQNQWSTFVDNTRDSIENSEGLTLVKEFSAHQLVADVILEYHRQHGEVLPVSEAGKLVEDHITNEAEKFFKNPTLRGHYSEYLTPGEEASKNSATQSLSQGSQQAAKGPKTLTNNLTASTPNRSSDLLSHQQSLDKMAAMLRWDS